MPTNVTSSDARKRFSALLAAAEKGETVFITRRGKVVASLAPVAQPVASVTTPVESVPIDASEARKMLDEMAKDMPELKGFANMFGMIGALGGDVTLTRTVKPAPGSSPDET